MKDMNKIKRGFGQHYIRRAGRGTALLALVAGMAMTTACSDWTDHYDGAGTGDSGETLWEQISSNSELSDFASVLSATTVFRQHKKTTASYAELLQGGQALTVFAPVNGTFNRDSLLSLVESAQGDSAVEAYFVKNHLAEVLRSDAGTETTLRLLSGKRITFGADQAAGVAMSHGNMRAKNGVMHVMSAPIPYVYNVYEGLQWQPELSSAGNRLASYTEDVFDEDASISSGMVDGIPVYVDSVVNERNRMLEAVGLLDAEDSVYYAVVPTTEGWQKAWAEASAHFTYPADMEKGDSLRDYWATRGIFDDAIFSMTQQKSPQDSVQSSHYDIRKPEYHVFHHPFDADGIFGRAKHVETCSNGRIYVCDEWPFKPSQTYFRRIELEAEQTWLMTDYSLCRVGTRQAVADSISENAYADIVPSGGNSQWKVTYKLSNTLAGTYDFQVVVLPKTVYSSKGNMRPCKFKAIVNYVDADGTAKSYDCNGGKAFITDPNVVDTITVAKGFRLPACNYNQNNNKVSITLQCDISVRENARYNREMYLDAIFLQPNDDTDMDND